MNARRNPLWMDLADGLRSQPARTGLSFLALAVGITALTVLLAVLTGLEQRSRRILQDLGVNAFAAVQSRGESGSRAAAGLQEEHVELLRASLPGCTVAGLRVDEAGVRGVGEVQVVATDAALLQVRQWPVTAGRFLDAGDARRRARVAVVTETLLRVLRARVGDVLWLGDTPFEIVGAVAVGGAALDAESAHASLLLGDRTVFVPLTTPPYWQGFGRPSRRLDAVFVRAAGPDPFESVLAQAQRLLSQPGVAAPDVSWVTPRSLLAGVRRLQTTIELTVGSIAVLCLVLGGTTLMSLMVANVRERVAEIGLRRTLGATARDIVVLFVCEACVVTAGAAACAVGVTHAVLGVVRARLPVPIGFGPWTVAAPLLVAMGLGVLFSYWPARAAAAITPSEALRND